MVFVFDVGEDSLRLNTRRGRRHGSIPVQHVALPAIMIFDYLTKFLMTFPVHFLDL